MELTQRLRRFLVAAYKATSANGREFVIADVGRSLGYTDVESTDAAKTLESKFDYIVGACGMPGSFGPGAGGKGFQITINMHLSPTTAHLTTTGREAARQMIDDARNAGRAKVFRAIKWICATLLSIALPVSIALLNRRIERIEKQQDRTPATMPTTRP